MKIKLLVFLLIGFLTASAYAGTKVLPDACGDDTVKFNVKTEKGKPAPTPPEGGKAQIVFISVGVPRVNLLVRYGLDGSWVGANKGDSYFAVSVAPGEHHFCATTGSFILQLSYAGTGAVTAEAGKTYYVEFRATYSAGGGSQGIVAAGSEKGQPVVESGGGSSSADLILVTDDEGKYRVKAFPLSTSTPKK